MTSVSAETTPTYHLTFPRIVRSEFIKLLSLRSSWWSLAVTAAISIGMSVLVALASPDFGPEFSAVQVMIMPMQFTMLVAGILGAISITGEYSTGMIRSTFTAEPRRGAVLVAKALAVAAVMALTVSVIFAIAVAVTAPLLGENQIEWSDAAFSWTPLILSVGAMVAFALMGLGFGFLIRNGAGAIAATVGVLFVLPIVTSMFAIAGEAWRWIVDAGRFLPMSAAQYVSTPGGDDILTGVLTLIAWPLVLLLASWLSVRVRDA